MVAGNSIQFKTDLAVAAIAAATLPCMAPARAADAPRLDLYMPRIVFALYGEHVSHLTQHEPFTSDPSASGYNTVNIAVTFERHGGAGAFLPLAEGYNISPHADES